MGFERFERSKYQKTSGSTDPECTIRKDGDMTVNGPALAVLGGAQHVDLMWDADRGLVGLRPAEEGPDSYPLRKGSGSKHARQISGRIFCKHHELIPAHTMAWGAWWSEADGLLAFCPDEKPVREHQPRAAGSGKASRPGASSDASSAADIVRDPSKKWCPQCEEERPKSEFAADARTADNLKKTCKLHDQGHLTQATRDGVKPRAKVYEDCVKGRECVQNRGTWDRPGKALGGGLCPACKRSAGL